jgi:glycosyltransferase involved in cell wall biosynthesis
MLVTIIIPSYNQGKFIRETIDSVIAQDYRPIEILVVDGASKDDTVDVLRSYGAQIQWWSEPDKGVVDAVNKGLARATGNIIAIQSSDDTFLPDAIATAANAFESDSSLGLVFGDVEYIDAASTHIGRTTLPPFTLGAYLAKQLFIPQPAAFFTKSAADRAGGWNDNVSYAADADFYLRIATIAPAKKLDALLGQYRYHEEQRDRIGGRIARDWEKAVRTWIEREHPSPELRRDAELGIHLTHAHYLGDAQWARRTWELYSAALIAPSAIARADFPRRELIPGRTPVWRVLSRIKRALGFKPR